ncbi:hypothetical protein CY658_31465 [Variovorax sp. RO1]|uniref:NIPSNAP family protein n=1 Tax=unclassified Variovorax TaxID=663243 RepID=UPI000C716CCD|nr:MULTISPECIES: NIPSNAP family protein [unclassified Variovorax]PLC01454.1 hypothetical protein CY658_31465 [Variovorax sp. RO1]QOF81108.1 NIPSNAP family protein [Variovorax sp. 38R]
MAYEARYVLRPNSGADLGAVIDAVKAGAALWKKHGASNPQFWSVAAGELGNYVLTVQFENATAYAKVTDLLSADPEFRRWQASNLASGAFTWVRSNLMRELPLA